jgi:hypothetical protein
LLLLPHLPAAKQRSEGLLLKWSCGQKSKGKSKGKQVFKAGSFSLCHSLRVYEQILLLHLLAKLSASMLADFAAESKANSFGKRLASLVFPRKLTNFYPFAAAYAFLTLAFGLPLAFAAGRDPQQKQGENLFTLTAG